MSSSLSLAAPESAAKELPPPASWRMDFFYPHIQVGVTEPVLVTQVIDPWRVFCQLRSLSHEVQRLSDNMHHYYELQGGYGDASIQYSFILGQPCASRGNDGRWYRSLLQEYMPDRRLAMVVHVDWGRKDVVPMSSLRALAPDFFRMPVVTFPCSLYGVSDRGCGWDPAQVFELRSLLYGRQLSAKIEFYNSYEHLYVVNLFGDDGFNLNRLFDMRAHTLKSVCQANKIVADSPVPVEEVHGGGKAQASDVPKQRFYVPVTPTQELKVGKFYDAFVEHVSDPSNFWIRIAENASNYSKVINGIARLYSQASKLDGIIPKPQRGQLCCTKFKDNQYYRAEVVATHDKKVEVYFIDYGNSEIVDWYNVKELPAQYRDMPGSAIRCCVTDIYPLGEEWSSEAIVAFKVAVVDKKLVVYILSKESDKYMVEVLDQSRIEQRSIGKILADAGHAKFESHELLDELPTLITTMAIGKEDDIQLNEPVAGTKSHRTHQQEPVSNQAKQDKAQKLVCSPFEDQFFEPGTTVEVVVSSVDNPGLFWCRNAGHTSSLNHLMNKIQEYCSNTDCPYDMHSSSCLARSPRDGRWYRAFVTTMPICASDSATVEVQYVDYGRKEMVPVRDLRSIKSEFFNLKAHAFRCSLYNIIVPIGSDPFCWDTRATELFNEFVEGASGKGAPFCCMFFAIASLEDEMFNIVDLFTPFTSVCNLLVERRSAAPLSHKSLDPSVQLHSYFYSLHDIKIGCEEEIYVTHINPSMEFYCQLSRNAETVEDISSIVTRASSKAQESTIPGTLGPLCLARFTDKQWYRGFISSNANTPEVFFVDFGNTDKVDKKDLLPIKQNEYELLLFPMQAIKCALSDVPPNVPAEVVSWFENAVLDKPLKAIVVAKETDGKLVVELYSGNRQINTSIKSKLGLKSQKDTANSLLHFASDNVRNGDTKKSAYNTSKGETRDLAPKTYQVNTKRDDSRFPQSSSRNAVPRQKADYGKDRTSSETKPVLNNKSQQMPSSFKDRAYKTSPPQIKLKDLPKRNLFPGLQFPVYISHINSIYDFSVQIAQDPELCDISETLNDARKRENILEKDVSVGDLVCAFFADDELNYRAVVKEKTSDGLHVEYVDYGNTSVVPVSKTSRLPEKLLSYPVMSFHCTLNQQSFCSFNDDDLLLRFSERTNDLQLCCEFIQQCGDKWEVHLSDQQGSVNDFLTSSVSAEPLPAEPTNGLSSDDTGNTTENATSGQSFVWNLPQPGETVEVYVSAVDSPEYFWCQLTTSDVDGLAVKIQEAGEQSIKDDDFISVIETGSPCNVMYSEDNNWYRAIVTSMEAKLITVRFVDYGNEETVNADHVRPLPNILRVMPVLAFPCCLAGFNPSDGCWTSDANTFFYNRVTEDILEITIVGNPPHRISSNLPLVSVDVKYKGENINEEMRQFWCVGDKRDSSASLTDDLKPASVSLELESISDSSLPDSSMLGELSQEPCVQENVAPQENNEEEIKAAEDQESSAAWIASQGETAVGMDDAEESPGYLFFGTRQDEAVAADRATSQEEDLLAKDMSCMDSLAVSKSTGADVTGPLRDPELTPVMLEIFKPEDVQRADMHSIQDLSGEEELMRSLHGVGFTEAVMYSPAVTFRESIANLTDSCPQDSFSEENVTESELCDADIKVFSPSLQEDHDISTYVEYPVPEDSSNEITETDVCESDTGDLEGQENEDFYTCAESVDLGESATLYRSDIYGSEVAILESLDVYAEGSLPVLSSSCVDTSDQLEAATADLENTQNPDFTEWPVTLDPAHSLGEGQEYDLEDPENQEHTESPAPFDIGDSTKDFCEPDGDYLESVAKRDLPAEDNDAVYTRDVYDSKDGDLEREDTQDLYEPLYTECEVPMENPDSVNEDAVESAASDEDGTDIQNLLAEDNDAVYTRDVYDSKDGDLEREDTQDLYEPLYTECEVPVENPDSVYEDAMESAASDEDGTDTQIPGWPQCPETADNVIEQEAGDLERLDNQDVPGGTEHPALAEHEDAVHTSDVCVTGDGGLERDLQLVYSEGPAPVSSSDNLYVSDTYEPEAGDVDLVDMEDWPANTASPAPVDNADHVYSTDAYKSGAGDLQREDNEGITLYTECLLPVVASDDVYETDTCNPYASSLDGLETKDVPGCVEGAAPDECEDTEYTGDVRGSEGHDLEGDLLVCTESPAPVVSSDTLPMGDTYEPEAGYLDRADMDDWPVDTESPAPVDNTDNTSITGVYKHAASDQERQANEGVTLYTECLVYVESPGDACNPDASNLGGTEIKVADLAVGTESPAPADTTDNSEGDVHSPEPSLPSDVGMEDTRVFTGSCVLADRLEDVCTLALINTFSPDLDSTGHRDQIGCGTDLSASGDLPVNTESTIQEHNVCDDTQHVLGSDPDVSDQGLAGSAGPADSPHNVSIRLICEPETNALERVKTSDPTVCAESPATVSTETGTVDVSEACEPEAGVLEREDNQESGLYTADSAAEDCANGVTTSPICHLEIGGSQDLPVYAESPAPVGNTDVVYTCEICESEDGEIERAEGQDLALHTVSPAPVAIMCMKDVGEPDAGRLEEEGNADCALSKESSHPDESAGQVPKRDADQTEDGDLESSDNRDFSTSCDRLSLI